ncbi:survival of motor neuron-related-splicing factor 30-like isoform X2 [Crassostrea virginica]
MNDQNILMCIESYIFRRALHGFSCNSVVSRETCSEVIDLTEELVGNKQLAAIAVDAGASASGTGSTEDAEPTQWSVGEPCLAPWSKDGQYYDAKIDEILDDGTCAVTFESYGNTDVTEVKLLRKVDASQQKKDLDKKPKSKRDQIAEQKEYRRKKQQKKAQRLKQMEEEREQEKNKWLDFNTKTFSKTNKGKVKKSIFATPDAVNGKVGVGTCGQGGRPMTSFQHAEKWRK